ncbi:MAG: hypothetical protein A2Z21_08135 [Candidatus Fraserbacteria bacterium RBG_16_55_9]|uniref:POTRA domain-containing protein n=1 Tax=Fraserbacteria sp. (strain RBG_16_55_9) TaxID=1817864 RepID=A0A1F5UNL5_FRAXR|nr:MAG: hypothetical protein A2Z21_08135 [Candidatus Fraserbacteria bacterium RBG_16_55_9]
MGQNSIPWYRLKTLAAFLLIVAGGLAALWLSPVEMAHAKQAPETGKTKVVEIQIEGNDHISARDIKAVLPFKEGDEITLPDALMRAELKLKDMGPLENATGDYRLVEDGIVVIFKVVENPVIQKIEITGNRDWNEGRRLDIPLIGLSLRWPLVDYLVTTERMLAILKDQEIQPGKVLNTNKLADALGIGEGGCAPNPPPASLCGEYKSKGYFLFAIGNVEPGETLKIQVLEGVIESIDLQGLEEPLKSEVLKMMADLPVLRPVKLQQMQEVLQRLAQSVYFETLRPEDVAFDKGSAPDQVRLVLNLKVLQLIEGSQAIKRIQFIGNTAFSEGELLPRVELPGGAADNYQLLTALQGVYRFYRKEGYFMVKFTKEQLVDEVLTLRVDEGRIGEIEIRQNSYPTLRLTSAGPVEVPVGNVQSPAEEPPSEQNSNILLQLLTHVSDFLGNILGTTAAKSGLPRTKPEIIAKTITLEPGQLVNQFRLADSYRKLLSLGYFKDVSFDFQPIESSSALKMIIDVAEQEKLGSLNGGFSVSSEGLVGQLSVNGKNLYGTGQDVSLQFDRGILGKAVMNWTLEYQSRTLVEGSDYFDIKLFNNNSNEKTSEEDDIPRPVKKAYFLNRVGVEASLAYPWEGVQLIFGLRHETFTKDFEGEDGPKIEHGLTDSISLTLNYDDRNNPLFATRGGLESFRVEQAGFFALGTEFTKLQATVIRHFSTLEDQNIAVRLVGGLGLDLLNDPQEQFMLGGSTTLRGITPERTPTMGYMNLEYRIQFIPTVFSIALFADVGSGLPFELKKSVGIEARVALPYVGPIRLAFAWPVTDRIEYFKVEFGFGSLF